MTESKSDKKSNPNKLAVTKNETNVSKASINTRKPSSRNLLETRTSSKNNMTSEKATSVQQALAATSQSSQKSWDASGRKLSSNELIKREGSSSLNSSSVNFTNLVDKENDYFSDYYDNELNQEDASQDPSVAINL
jgi:hypothetical protein